MLAGVMEREMKRVRLVDSERLKPISFDPAGQRYLFFRDIGGGAWFYPTGLTEDQKQDLVLRRYALEKDSTVDSLAAMDLRQQMDHISSGTEVGVRLMAQEITYLEELIQKIEAGIVY